MSLNQCHLLFSTILDICDYVYNKKGHQVINILNNRLYVILKSGLCWHLKLRLLFREKKYGSYNVKVRLRQSCQLAQFYFLLTLLWSVRHSSKQNLPSPNHNFLFSSLLPVWESLSIKTVMVSFSFFVYMLLYSWSTESTPYLLNLGCPYYLPWLKNVEEEVCATSGPSPKNYSFPFGGS